MPLTLSKEQQEEVLRKMKTAFSDFQYFDSLITKPIRKLIEDATRQEITPALVDNVIKHYIENPSQYKSKEKEKKEIFDKMKIILTATAVYLRSLHPAGQSRFYRSVDELLRHYPHWNEQLDSSKPEDAKELELLLNFRNFMSLALELIKGKNKKIFLLRVVERLEGSNNEYITGTGQKASVTRRATDIFHSESGVPFTHREKDEKEEKEEKAEVAEEGREGNSNSASITHNKRFLQEEEEEEREKDRGTQGGGGGGSGGERDHSLPLAHKKTKTSHPHPHPHHSLPLNPLHPPLLGTNASSHPRRQYSPGNNNTINPNPTGGGGGSSDLIEVDSLTAEHLLNEDYQESFTEVIRRVIPSENIAGSALPLNRVISATSAFPLPLGNTPRGRTIAAALPLPLPSLSLPVDDNYHYSSSLTEEIRKELR
jgi:hypothetical protein